MMEGRERGVPDGTSKKLFMDRQQDGHAQLPISDVTPVGLMTYDAKDSDTAFPPI
jgi:hypothetical protein